MGWTSFRDYNPDQSRADIIRREFTQAATADNPTSWGFEQISTRGAIVYAIMHRDTPDQPRVYFGMIFITERKNGNFAYKDISEDRLFLCLLETGLQQVRVAGLQRPHVVTVLLQDVACRKGTLADHAVRVDDPILR